MLRKARKAADYSLCSMGGFNEAEHRERRETQVSPELQEASQPGEEPGRR